MNSLKTSSNDPLPERHRAFKAEPRLLYWRDACAAARSAPEACQRCEDICPASALSVRNDGPELAAACLGCGRCAAACPTGALAVKGFKDEALPAGNASLRIECWKVPNSLLTGDTIRVPCLGGVTLAQLLRWCDSAAERPITFVEHGWCTGCSAGGVRHPGNAVVLQANRLLEACGKPSDLQAAWESKPFPIKYMPLDIPTPAAGEMLGRRAFFRRFVSEVAASVPASAAAPAPVKSLRRQSGCPMPAREQVLALLPALAAQYARPVPQGWLPTLKISDACQHHGVCGGVCPTGALTLYKNAGDTGIEFDSELCIACDLCSRSCPEQAITVQAHGGSIGSQRLTLTQIIECTSCRREYASAGNNRLCPTCQKQQEQGRSLFGMFNAR